jgi:hypothetical protein
MLRREHVVRLAAEGSNAFFRNPPQKHPGEKRRRPIPDFSDPEQNGMKIGLEGSLFA